MKSMKIKNLEEVKIHQDKTLRKIKRDFKIQTAFMTILVVLALIICFKSMKIAIEYAELEKEKEALEEIIEVQKNLLGGNE